MKLRTVVHLCVFMCAGVAIASAPNIVLIVADDLGWAGVGYHNPTVHTPNLDRLAEEGVRFERFYVSPICSPTRAGILTGRWPIRFGIMASQIRPFHDWGIDPDEETLPEMLSRAGYERRALVGKWHLGDSRGEFLPLNQGFTSFYGCLGAMVDSWTHEAAGRPTVLDWWRNEELLEEDGHVTELLTREAVSFIETNAKRPPFFLLLSYTAPHQPYMPMDEDLEHYIEFPKERSAYAAVVTGMDRGVGDVLRALDRTGIREDTFVVFISDNGDRTEYWNHPYRGIKRSSYEGAIRVPAIMRWPAGGLAGGRIVNERVGYIDLMPTLKAAVGLEHSTAKPLDGIDILDVARGETTLEEREWYTYSAFRGDQKGVRMALSTDQWKLVYEGPDPRLIEMEMLSAMELYEIGVDPFETNDVLKQNRELAREMYARLRAFLELEPEDAPR